MEDQARARFFIGGQPVPAAPLAPGLYVVSTPIGNLGDITLRALATLAAADLILCEDTRHSARLLDHYGIVTRKRSLHEHNERAGIEAIAARLAGGEAMALISDAGTPLLSDPGFPLVRALREADLPVFIVPGASALLAGLAGAGLPTDAFAFHGFMPPRAAARRTAIAELAARRETLVFYESPRRLGVLLADLATGLGPERDAVVGLELTKRFERFERGTLNALAQRFGDEEPRGEAVVLVAGAGAPEPVSEDDWQTALFAAMRETSLREAVDAVAARYGLKRKEVYGAALAHKGES